MLGAIAGDIIGSVYEGSGLKTKDFPLFSGGSTLTDDTVLTVAVAEALLAGGEFAPTIKAYARARPNAGYGASFHAWMSGPDSAPYNSFGNGAAMRVSPVAYAAETLDAVLHLARRSAECTHDHPDGIAGAQAVALAVLLARQGSTREEIRAAVGERFGYDLRRTVDAIRPTYRPDLSCPGSVPEALIAFLDSGDFEDAIRNAVSLGGDADTQAAIAGGVAEAYYGGVTEPVVQEVWRRLPAEYQDVIRAFAARFALPTTLPAA